MPNSPLRIVQTQSLFEPAAQTPSLIQKKNNNKNNKNLSLKKNKNQNVKKEEEEEYEEEEEINEEIEEQNYNMHYPPKKKVIENVPQLINSFYFLNENLKKQNSINSINNININNNTDTALKNNQENNSNIINNLTNGIITNINNTNNNNNNSNKIKEKSKTKKSNVLMNKNTLQILENFDLTNEEKLLYILDNYKNIKINPLILKVLESRKNNRKNGIENKSIYNNQNINGNSINDKDLKGLSSNKKNILNNGTNNNNMNSSALVNDNNGYISPQPIRPSFPMDDKILFKNLEKFKISLDILDRPNPVKIELNYHILNKLFIIWDFLITFKDTVFTEKVYDLEINKNIMTFYLNLIDKKNNYQYYKNIFVSLLLLCVKNIPNVMPSPKDQRIFLLKSILDNLHSISFNIISDSPLIVLKEITESYLYNNSIEENNFKILQNVLIDVNNAKNKESFENNKKIYEKEEDNEDNICKIDNEIKIYLLHIMIGLCFETIFIKDKLKNEYDNMNSLSYSKKGLDESLFDTEKRMKELNRMENFKTLPKEIENLEKKLTELKGEGQPMQLEDHDHVQNVQDPIGSISKANSCENLEKIEKIEVDEEKNEKENNNINNNNEEENKKKEIKELETQIERYKSILIENDKLIERKKDINIKINEIIESIYNLKTLRKKYLGIDYQNNEYYYFISVPNKIYTKNKKKKEWGYYENKEDIQKLINKLTEKGKNEKKLKIILKFIFSQMKEKEEKQKQKEEKEKIAEKEKEKEKQKEEETPKMSEDKKDNNNNNDILIIENDKEINIKEFEKPNDVQIKIDKNLKTINITEEDNNKIKNNSNSNDNSNNNNNNTPTVHKISLRGPGRKPNKSKSKEKSQIDNIHIIEDDDEEEIEEEKEQEEDLEENYIQEENVSESKIKIINNNINIKKDNNEDNKTASLSISKKELFTFVISEDRLQLNVILMKIDDVFSEYLVQFNKQWESEKNRAIWKKIITTNATDKNILTTLKMFNHKFKNPYKILSAEEEQELLLKDKANKGNNFIFEEEGGNSFSIPETNNLLMLSPKVKIWSKEMDLIDIDNYYNNNLLVNVYCREQLCYVVHFYEMAIFGLVHRREGKRKL